MKVSINKLMRHPSHESDEVGAVDIYKDADISSCIEETMAADKSKIILINCVVMPLFGLNQ